MPPPFHVQGHRGARGLRPENTLPSFEAALDAAVRSIETDLHLTRDDAVVLCHDPRLSDRLFRPCAPDAPALSFRPAIRSLTLAQLRLFQADRNPDPARFPSQEVASTSVAARYAQEHGLHLYAVPTLEDLFGFVAAYATEMGRAAGKDQEQRRRAGQLVFDLELKRVPYYPETIGDGYDGRRAGVLEQRVVEAVRAAGVVDRTTVRSFDHRCVRELLRLEPGLTGAMLMAEALPVDLGAVARAAGASIYCPSWAFLDAQAIRQAHEAGLRVVPWTVNEPEVWQQLVDWGVDGITTDYPDRLARFLGERDIVY